MNYIIKTNRKRSFESNKIQVSTSTKLKSSCMHRYMHKVTYYFSDGYSKVVTIVVQYLECRRVSYSKRFVILKTAIHEHLIIVR